MDTNFQPTTVDDVEGHRFGGGIEAEQTDDVAGHSASGRFIDGPDIDQADVEGHRFGGGIEAEESDSEGR